MFIIYSKKLIKLIVYTILKDRDEFIICFKIIDKYSLEENMTYL